RDRGRPSALLARGVDGAQRRAADRRPGLDVQAQGGRRDDVGDHAADGPGRRLRDVHRLPAREVLPRREDLPDLRGHGPGPAPGRLAPPAGGEEEVPGGEPAGTGTSRGVSTATTNEGLVIEIDRELCYGF